MTTLGGWCQPAPGCTHTERQHVACRSRVCGCEAFGGHVGAQVGSVERDSGSVAVESGVESGPESALTDRGLATVSTGPKGA